MCCRGTFTWLRWGHHISEGSSFRSRSGANHAVEFGTYNLRGQRWNRSAFRTTATWRRLAPNLQRDQRGSVSEGEFIERSAGAVGGSLRLHWNDAERDLAATTSKSENQNPRRPLPTLSIFWRERTFRRTSKRKIDSLDGTKHNINDGLCQ